MRSRVFTSPALAPLNMPMPVLDKASVRKAQARERADLAAKEAFAPLALFVMQRGVRKRRQKK
jgi:hypothetical protein